MGNARQMAIGFAILLGYILVVVVTFSIFWHYRPPYTSTEQYQAAHERWSTARDIVMYPLAVLPGVVFSVLAARRQVKRKAPRQAVAKS